MANNLGKKFEAQFKNDFLKIPNSTIDRIYDPGFGMKGISNICDFIAYVYPNIYYFECKSKIGNTFPLDNLKQYDKLIQKKNIKGVIVGVILWFIEHDKILFIPIETFEKLKKDEKKSFNIKMVGDNNYPSIEIPSIKKRMFMESDYSVLLNRGGEDDNISI